MKKYTREGDRGCGWSCWCEQRSCAEGSRRQLDIIQLTEDHIKEYRGYLVDKGLKVATIGLKLSVIRRIFEIAVIRGFMAFNPALRVKPPSERRDPAAANNYLELEEAQKLVDVLPTGSSLKELRALATPVPRSGSPVSRPYAGSRL